MGREGIAEVLNWSQVILSILLPIVSAPLIYFTNRKKYMCVPLVITPDSPSQVNEDDLANFESDNREIEIVDMSNSVCVQALGILIWLFITCLNV